MSADNTSSPRKMEREGAEAMNHLVQGKRHILVQDYPSAVYSLQESVQLFTKYYGETANECGEAYFCYGKALLEMAREETGVLGNAISRDSGDEEEDEDDDDDGENVEKGAEAEDKDGEEDEDKEEEDDDNEGDDENKGNTEKENDDDNDSEAMSENISNQSPDSTSQADFPSEAEAGASGSQKAESEEEVSTLQLAWEVLELAKVIFKRQAENNKAMQLKTADVLLKLGEVSIESENYKQAVDDLLECLEIQTEYLEPDSRQLAETHYQLGLAHSFDSEFEDAIKCFKNAVDVIEKRIANLKKLIADLGGSSTANQDSIMCMSEDPVTKAQIEVNELESILPDMQSKIEDMEDLTRNARKALFEANAQKLEEANFGSGSGSSSSIFSSEAISSKPVSSMPTTNISHLVKRRKPDSVADVSSSSDSKKPKLEQSSSNLNGELSASSCRKEEREASDLNEVSADTTQ